MKPVIALLVWIVLLGGLYPLLSLWRSPSSKLGRLLVGTMSASYLWCLAGVIFPSAIGPHYSDARLAIIQGNLFCSIVLSIVAAKLLDRKALALIAGGWLAAIWLYMRVISFVA